MPVEQVHTALWHISAQLSTLQIFAWRKATKRVIMASPPNNKNTDNFMTCLTEIEVKHFFQNLPKILFLMSNLCNFTETFQIWWKRMVPDDIFISPGVRDFEIGTLVPTLFRFWAGNFGGPPRGDSFYFFPVSVLLPVQG